MRHCKLEVKNLNFAYPDGHKAVNDMTFCINNGSLLNYGANGAGKSTLLMLIMGILFPFEGEVMVGDMPVSKNIANYSAKTWDGFSGPDDQLFMTTVYDDAALTAKLQAG